MPPPQLIVLDRDGVINADSSEYIKSPDEWQPLPGALDAIAALTRHGFRVAIATNQSGIGRGLFTRATLEAIHAKLRAAVSAAGGRIASIHYCPHRPDDGCECRKPAPGLLLAAAAEAGIAPASMIFIGDKPSDVGAARAAGAEPILVGRAARQVADDDTLRCYRDLAAAVEALLAEAAPS